MKSLLEQVMPEFERVPDRIEQVRRKVRVQRDRTVAAGAAAAVLAVVALGAGAMAWRPTDLEFANAVYQDCQQENVKPRVEDLKPRTEDVPAGASKVTLCVYEGRMVPYPSGPADGESSFAYRFDLVGARDQQSRVGAIEQKVNAMAPPPMCTTPTGEYQLVFDYPDKSRFVVSLTHKCDAPIPEEELLRGGDLLGLLDRMDLATTYYWSPDRPTGDK